MSWRDRAIDEDAAPKVSGSWRDRAVVEDDEDMEDPEAKATRMASELYDQQRPSAAQSFGVGNLQGVTRNWGDEAIAKASALMHGGSSDDYIGQVRHKLRRAELENPKLYGLGDFTGAVGSASLLPVPGGVGGNAAYGFAEGATRSLGNASKINKEAVFEAAQTGTQDAMMSAAFAKYGPRIFEAIGNKVKPLAKSVSDFAGNQAVRALGRATPTQTKNMAEKKLTADVGNWAMDNGVVTPFASSKKMLERTDKVLDGVAQEMAPLYKAASGQKVSADQLQKFLEKRADTIAKEPGGIPLSEQLLSFKQEIAKAAEKGRTEYTPEALKKFRQRVQDRLNFNSEPLSQEGGRRFRNILRANEMALIRKEAPESQRLNEKLFRSVHLGNRARDVAERGAAQSQVNNRIGLTSSIVGSGVASALLSAGTEPAVATGLGLASGVTSELVKRFGNQWTGRTARRLAQAINSDTYRPFFEEAVKKGPAAIASLHDQLMDNDPAYSSIFDEEKKKALGDSTLGSKARAVGLSATNNLLAGNDDEVAGFAGAIGAGLKGQPIGAAYTRDRDQYRNAKEAAGLKDPWAYHGTDIASNALMPAIPASMKGISEGSRILRGAGAGAVLGGLTGLGNAKELSDVPRETLQSLLMGSLMGGVAGGLNAPKAGVRDSGVPRNTPKQMTLPRGTPEMKRPVEIDGKKLEHWVFQKPGEKLVEHYLVDSDTKRPLANIYGWENLRPEDPGFQVEWAQSNVKGLGRKLYDLVLDTHGKITSDEQLSKEGSHKVYTDYLAKQGDLDAKLASWGNTDRHQVKVKDRAKFRESRGFSDLSQKDDVGSFVREQRAAGVADADILDDLKALGVPQNVINRFFY